MKQEVAPKDLARVSGISASYASQIVNGKRPCPQEVALAAFRAFGVRLGLLAEMTEEDVARLCAQQCASFETGEQHRVSTRSTRKEGQAVADGLVHAPLSTSGGAASAKSGGEGFNATSSGATSSSSPAPETGARPPMVGNVQGGAPVPFETAGASTGSAARLPQDERIEEQAA